ncbi:hypothetical protein FQR65_LT04881 [Abscondita terminalis]|nr:hypothetical protein FQR65_LT04881 [Abscondita terminalis]
MALYIKLIFVVMVAVVFADSAIEVNFPDDVVITQENAEGGEGYGTKFFIFNSDKNRTITIQIWSNNS